METKTRKLRAELNRILQACKTEVEARAECKEFQERHGSTIWHVPTGHGGIVEGPYAETFLSLAKAHLARVVEDDASKAADEEREANILSLIESSTIQEFKNLVHFVNRRPSLSDRSDVEDALLARGRYLEIAEYCVEEEPV